MESTCTVPKVADGPEVKTRLRRFMERLVASGYAEFLSTIDPYSYLPLLWPSLRSSAFPELRTLIDLLLLNRNVHVEGLEEAVGDSWQVLADIGLLTRSGEWVSIPGHSLLFYLGFFAFVDSPSNADPNVYFGDDSIALFCRLAPLPDDRVLDLCSGSGIQALKSAVHARSVDAVEVNAVPRRALQINVLLNALSDKISVFGGSLFDALPAGERYDLITANPPLVPFPDGLAYPFVGHGGIDGFAVVRRIIQGLPCRLSDRGRAQIIAMTFSSRGLPMVSDELKALAGELDLDIQVTLINHFSLSDDSPYFQGLVKTAGALGTQDLATIDSSFREELAKRNLTQLTPYYLALRKGSGRVAYQNFTRIPHHGLWHVKI